MITVFIDAGHDLDIRPHLARTECDDDVVRIGVNGADDTFRLLYSGLEQHVVLCRVPEDRQKSSLAGLNNGVMRALDDNTRNAGRLEALCDGATDASEATHDVVVIQPIDLSAHPPPP